MKKHVIAVLVAAAALSPLVADVMDQKAAVVKTVETSFAGTAEVTCDDAKGWTFDVSASVDDGRDVVTVRLSRADDAVPPRFGVFFRVSGAADRPVFLVNATGKAGVLAELAAKPAKVEYFDVFGEKTGEAAPSAGLVRLAVPVSGYARIEWPK